MGMTTETVTSRDGTTIAFDRMGSGPAIALVSGGSTDRSANAPLAELLAANFTVLNYDRRGRGPSGDTQPYAIEREVEDIQAVLSAARDGASLYGTSSGAALALEAAASGVPLAKLALWEPPFIQDENARPPADQVERYETMLAEDRRGDMVEFFMREVVRMPPEFVDQARSAPFWAATEAIAHTLPYDARIMGDYSIPIDRAERVDVPALVLVGGASFPFMRETAETLAAALPQGEVRVLDGQTHDVAPDVMAGALATFLR